MSSLIEKQIALAENFVNSIPDSTVKGSYESWLLEVKRLGRLPADLLEKFVALSVGLPKEFQSFPQNFVQAVKNDILLEDESVDKKVKSKTKK